MDGGEGKKSHNPHTQNPTWTGRTGRNNNKTRGVFWIFHPWAIYKQSVSLSAQTRGKAKLRVHRMTFFKHLNKHRFNPASSSNLFSHHCQQCQMLHQKVQEFHGRQTQNNLLSQEVSSSFSDWFPIQRINHFTYFYCSLKIVFLHLQSCSDFWRLLWFTGIILPSFVLQEHCSKRALGLIRHLMKN